MVSYKGSVKKHIADFLKAKEIIATLQIKKQPEISCLKIIFLYRCNYRYSKTININFRGRFSAAGRRKTKHHIGYIIFFARRRRKISGF